MLDWTLPIPTVSEANVSEHWSIKRKRQKAQEALIKCRWNVQRPAIKLPCIVKLTRISTRTLDDDNLVCSLKHVRDILADLIRPGFAPGRADGTDLIKWEYAQAIGKVRQIRIEVSSNDPSQAVSAI